MDRDVRDRAWLRQRHRLVEANGGTMFFDEIGGLSLESQPKLLRALDGYAFRPVGASRDRESDFRVVAATNEDVPAMVAAGRFRADLWFRLAGMTLRVPPLSARLDDLPELVEQPARSSVRTIGATATRIGVGDCRASSSHLGRKRSRAGGNVAARCAIRRGQGHRRDARYRSDSTDVEADPWVAKGDER